jgi:hypothetical protein
LIYKRGKKKNVKENDSASDSRISDCLILKQSARKELNEKHHRQFRYNAETSLACVSAMSIIMPFYKTIHIF